MRLPTERRLLEIPARAVTLTSLALLVWRTWLPQASADLETVGSEQLPAALARWSTSPPPRAIDVALGRVPSPAERDWIAALARTGTALSWSGDVSPLGIEVNSTAEPRPSYVVRVSSGPAAVDVHDRSRTLAQLQRPQALTTLRTSSLLEFAAATTITSDARAVPSQTSAVGRVAVIGAAGWEVKFAVAALEESGWRVEPRIIAAPGVIVGSVAPTALDTDQFAALVVLDPPGDDWGPSLARFVTSGGGLVASARAARARAVAPLAPARIAGSVPSVDTSIVTLSALGGYSLLPAANAVALERRGDAALVAAARSGSGRVLVSGYEDTWRWRMQGEENSIDSHRDWWTSLIGAVAYSRDSASSRSPESAPLAAWVAVAGAAAGSGTPVQVGRVVPWNIVLFALAAFTLLFEVFSRRRRGLA